MMGQYIKDSSLVNNSFECRYINLGTSTTVDEIGAGGISKLLRTFKIGFRVLQQLVSFEPEVVYFTLTATGGGFFKDTGIILLAKLFRKKIVYHLHNKGVALGQNKWYYNLSYRLVFRKAEVILLSEHLYGDVKKYVCAEQVHICPNGVPDASITVSVPKRKVKDVHLLFLSNLIESKGVFDLLEACQILKDKGIDFKCTLIGGEADISVARLKRTIQKLDLQSQVHYAGKRYGDDKALAYTEADIFVFPTYYPNECFPLVLLEAMQFSLPIVSTYEGGIQDIVENGKTGFLVSGQNIPDLAEHIEKLVNDQSLRTDFGTKGRKRYEEKFTLTAFETNFTNILKKITE